MTFGIGLLDVKKERNLETFFGGWGLNAFPSWSRTIIKRVSQRYKITTKFNGIVKLQRLVK